MSRSAFCLVAALASSMLLASVGLAQPVASEKSPTAATALSVVIPGAGQIYSGETAKGALILVGTSAALATGVVAVKREPYFGCPDPCWEFDTTPILVGAGIAGAIWLYGVLDAPGAARRANQRNGLVAIELAPVLIAAEGRRQPGLQLRASF